MYNSAYSFGGFGNSCTGTGLAGVLAYIAFVLTILCTIGEKWEYFTDIIEGRGKKKKHRHKKKKKTKRHSSYYDECYDDYDDLDNDEFYDTLGL